MGERLSPHILPRGEEVRAVWNPQEPRTPLELAWAKLPEFIKDYFEIGYMLGDPDLSKDKKSEMNDKRRDMLVEIVKDPVLFHPFLDFINLRDAKKNEKK